jgi:hypothetical protein
MKGDAGTPGRNGEIGTCLHSCPGFIVENARPDILFFHAPPRIPSKIKHKSLNSRILKFIFKLLTVRMKVLQL